MQALRQLIWLQSLDSIIDCLLLMVVPKKLLLDAMSTTGYAYVLMVALGKSVLAFSSLQVVRYFTKYCLAMLLASRTSLKIANILEVIHTSIMTLNVSELLKIVSVLSLLHQQQLHLLRVVDNQGNVAGNITLESICQAPTSKTEKTRGNTSICFFERELLKYKWLLARAIVRKDTRGKPTRLVGVSVDSTSCVQIEGSFRESERLFRAIFNGILKFSRLLTKEGILLEEVNQTALNFGELQPQYFLLFYRASNVGNILCTRLAIAIVKKCVDIYQGKIFVTSSLRFWTKLTNFGGFKSPSTKKPQVLWRGLNPRYKTVLPTSEFRLPTSLNAILSLNNKI
jgi:hypothetical protein